MVQKLSDKIQVMMLPSGQNFILDWDILRMVLSSVTASLPLP